MNPFIPAVLVGALLLPVPPVLPHTFPGSVGDPAPDSVAGRVGGGWLEPTHQQAVWPLAPRPTVVAGFAPPAGAWSPGHRGVDLLGRPGQRVRAALGGTVTFAGTVAGRGVVVVDHGSFRTTYEPVRALVRAGVVVDTGADLGTLQTGRSHCAPRACLHWGLIEGDAYRDPLTLLGQRRVRLLPAPQALG